MDEEIKQLNITPDEAIVIDISLKDKGIGQNRNLLLLIGQSLIHRVSVTIDLTENDLWYLRDCILDPKGTEILIKIYTLLLEFEKDKILGEIAIGELEDARYEDKDNTKDCSESESRPRQTIES